MDAARVFCVVRQPVIAVDMSFWAAASAVFLSVVTPLRTPTDRHDAAPEYTRNLAGGTRVDDAPCDGANRVTRPYSRRSADWGTGRLVASQMCRFPLDHGYRHECGANVAVTCVDVAFEQLEASGFSELISAGGVA